MKVARFGSIKEPRAFFNYEVLTDIITVSDLRGRA